MLLEHCLLQYGLPTAALAQRAQEDVQEEEIEGSAK